MFDVVSYLYVEDVTVVEGAIMTSPSQSLEKSLVHTKNVSHFEK